MRDHGRKIAGKEGLAVAQADNEGAPVARPHNAPRLVAVDGRDAVGALYLAQGCAQGRLQIAVIVVLAQMGEYLAVGLALEYEALRLEFLFEAGVVLDNAIVNNGDLSRHRAVGVGIFSGDPAVSGPAGMADAAGGRKICRDHRTKV